MARVHILASFKIRNEKLYYCVLTLQAGACLVGTQMKHVHCHNCSCWEVNSLYESKHYILDETETTWWSSLNGQSKYLKGLSKKIKPQMKYSSRSTSHLQLLCHSLEVFHFFESPTNSLAAAIFWVIPSFKNVLYLDLQVPLQLNQPC